MRKGCLAVVLEGARWLLENVHAPSWRSPCCCTDWSAWLVVCLMLQRIANCDWSLYLLKYAMKASFVQDVTVDKSVAEQLGLHNISDEMLHLLSVLVLAKPVSPCEAAAHMAGINIYQASDKVDFVPSQPEAMRAHFVNENSTRLSVPPVDTYCARPEQFHNLTFTQYFSRFLVTKVRSTCGCPDAIPCWAWFTVTHLCTAEKVQAAGLQGHRRVWQQCV